MGGGFAAEVSLLEPRVLLAGTGADCDDEGEGSTDSCTEFAAATQFFVAWGAANAAYGEAETAADVGLLRQSLNADFAYIDAVEAANESYWGDVEMIDAAYYDALDAADEALWNAESAAYERLHLDFADAESAYNDALSAADAVMSDAFGAAWDEYDSAVAGAAGVRDDAYAAADSLAGDYYTALDDAEAEYQDDLDRAYDALYQAEGGDEDGADDAAHAAFDEAVRAAEDRRQEALADAESLYDLYWEAIVAADAAYDDAVAAADEDLWRAESDAWDIYSDAEAAAALVRRDAEGEAYVRFDEAVIAAYAAHETAYERAGEDWDTAEERAHREQGVKIADAAFAWYDSSLNAEEQHLQSTLNAEINWWSDLLGGLRAAAAEGAGPDDGPQGADPVADGPSVDPWRQRSDEIVAKAKTMNEAGRAAFKIHLETLLAESKLGNKHVSPRESGRLYKRDTPGVGGGFDCEDYALAYMNYLRNVLARDGELSDGTTSFPFTESNLSYVLAVNYLSSGGSVSGHAGVLVQFNARYFIVDPQTDYVSDAYMTEDEAKQAWWGYLQSRYLATEVPALWGLTTTAPTLSVRPYNSYPGQPDSEFLDPKVGCLPHFNAHMRARGMTEADLQLYLDPDAGK